MDIWMCLFIIVFLISVCYKLKKNNYEDYFMKKDYTTVLKGIMCIIVVLVHIPSEYSNRVQDIIGSFGYICVTLFFLFSAFGLMYSLENKSNYIKTFLRKRLLVILVPFFISNIIYAIALRAWKNGVFEVIKTILGISSISFITVLIIFYIIFYIICRLIKSNKYREILLVVFPIIYSIINYIFKIDNWPVEELGFSYGILLYKYFDQARGIKQNLALILSTIISIIFGILYLKFKSVFIVGDYILRIILGMSIISFIFLITQKVKIGNKVLKFLGNISYEIYLLHGLIIVLLQKTSITSSGIFIWMTIIFTVISASVLNIMDKKIIKRIKGE